MQIKKREILLIILLVCLITPIYLYRLNLIPSNITGDETTNLNIIYKVLFMPHSIFPLHLAWENIPFIYFYWSAFWVLVLGLDNSIFSLRFSVAIIAILTDILFFKLLKGYVPTKIAFLITLLFATNIWFLNFARGSWPNMAAVLFGLLVVYLFQKSQYQDNKFLILSGVAAGFCTYVYQAAIVFPISVILYLFFLLIKNKSKFEIKKLVIFITPFIAVSLPLLIFSIIDIDSFLSRPKTVFIFSEITANTSVIEVTIMLVKRLIAVASGLVFLNGTYIGNGIENLRYFPNKTPVVDPIIKMLFLSAFLVVFVKKISLNVWWIIYLFTLLTAGILSIDAPNLSRTLIIIPFIYLLSAISLTFFYPYLYKIFKKKLNLLLLAITCLIIYFNVSKYFSWIQSPQVLDARQPAIEFKEFKNWQNLQINRVSLGLNPLINQEWYQIRKNFHFNE